MLSSFTKILTLLSTEQIDIIYLEDVIKAFPLGVLVDNFGDGKTLECIGIINDAKGYQIGSVLKGFAPKGTFYTKHYHDAQEDLFTISGNAIETVTPIKLFPFKKISFPRERAHGFKVLEDWTFICRIYDKSRFRES